MAMTQQDIIDAVRNNLDDDEWNYDFEEDRKPYPILKTGCRIGGKLKSIREVVDFRETYFLVYAFCPINADTDNLAEISKFLHLANYGLVIGNFELDPREGEIRYKVFVDCEGLDALSPNVIGRAIHVPFAMFDRYGDGIAALSMGFSDADTEYAKVMEKESADDDDGDDNG